MYERRLFLVLVTYSTILCRAGNHSVTQSSFDAPCTPLDGGFDSGFQVSVFNQPPFPVFTLQVTDDTTRELLYLCKGVHQIRLPCLFKQSGSSASRNYHRRTVLQVRFSHATAVDSAHRRGTTSPGMVGAINAPATGPNTFDKFRQAAFALNGIVRIISWPWLGFF
jgi:hypothetical protein